MLPGPCLPAGPVGENSMGGVQKGYWLNFGGGAVPRVTKTTVRQLPWPGGLATVPRCRIVWAPRSGACPRREPTSGRVTAGVRGAGGAPWPRGDAATAKVLTLRFRWGHETGPHRTGPSQVSLAQLGSARLGSARLDPARVLQCVT
jgi:hypothetical protein